MIRIDKPDESNISLLKQLWQEAFGDSDEYIETFFDKAFSFERCRCVFKDDRIVSALYWFDCEFHNGKIAYLYAIATEKKHRGKGFCRKLIDNTHSHLYSLGYEASMLVPGNEELFNFYKSLGYRECTFISEAEFYAGKGFVAIKEVSNDEFTLLRREFLPAESVKQEKENIDFLAAQASLLCGEEFIMAARIKNNYIYAIEFLGSTDSIPAIINTLGCSKGRFRVPGDEKHFSMYMKLTDSSVIVPKYFGLAFD